VTRIFGGEKLQQSANPASAKKQLARAPGIRLRGRLNQLQVLRIFGDISRWRRGQFNLNFVLIVTLKRVLRHPERPDENSGSSHRWITRYF